MTEISLLMFWITAGACFLLWIRDRRRLTERLDQLALQHSRTRQMLDEFAEETAKITRQFSRLLSQDAPKPPLTRNPAGNAAPESRYLGVEKKHLVLSLAQKGHSTKEIAERLKLPSGEVDLILCLEQTSRARVPA